jgi:hypothetical protein
VRREMSNSEALLTQTDQLIAEVKRLTHSKT